MYQINFDRHLNLVNWSCIYWGIQEQLLAPQSALIYANKLIEENPDVDCPEMIELLIVDAPEKEAVLPLVEKLLPDKKAIAQNKEASLRRLRFILLLELQKTVDDPHTLLDKIENIYTDFGYPSDMEGFITYVPAQNNDYDVSEHSHEENEQHLIDKFNAFMDKECGRLV